MKLKYRKTGKEKRFALEEVKQYFKKAYDVFPNQQKSNDFVRKARRLAMKLRLRLPFELKKKFCKHCYSYIVPSKNCRVRLKNRKVVYYCFKCRKYMRIPYIKHPKQKEYKPSKI